MFNLKSGKNHMTSDCVAIIGKEKKKMYKNNEQNRNVTLGCIL